MHIHTNTYTSQKDLNRKQEGRHGSVKTRLRQLAA